jgi:hypothetical protein
MEREEPHPVCLRLKYGEIFSPFMRLRAKVETASIWKHEFKSANPEKC